MTTKAKYVMPAISSKNQMQKICRQGLPVLSSKYKYFMLSICREWLENLQRFIMHMHSHCSAY